MNKRKDPGLFDSRRTVFGATELIQKTPRAPAAGGLTRVLASPTPSAPATGQLAPTTTLASAFRGGGQQFPVGGARGAVASPASPGPSRAATCGPPFRPGQLVFDQVVENALYYSPRYLDEALGLNGLTKFFIYVSGVQGTNPALSVGLQLSANGVDWVIDDAALLLVNNVSLTGNVVLTPVNALLQPRARIWASLSGTNAKARVQIFITGRSFAPKYTKLIFDSVVAGNFTTYSSEEHDALLAAANYTSFFGMADHCEGTSSVTVNLEESADGETWTDNMTVPIMTLTAASSGSLPFYGSADQDRLASGFARLRLRSAVGSSNSRVRVWATGFDIPLL